MKVEISVNIFPGRCCNSNTLIMKILELFAGSQSFTNVAKELGYETFTSDIAEWCYFFENQ